MTQTKATGEFHPGEILGDELKARHFNQITFAKELGILKSVLNEVVKGKRPIRAKLALKLEKTLGIEAEFWLKAQMNYDLNKLRMAK